MHKIIRLFFTFTFLVSITIHATKSKNEAKTVYNKNQCIAAWAHPLLPNFVEIANGQKQQNFCLKHSGQAISALCILPNGDVATGSKTDGTIKIWDSTTGTMNICFNVEPIHPNDPNPINHVKRGIKNLKQFIQLNS